MRIACTAVATVVLGLATAAAAHAQNESRNQDRNNNERRQEQGQGQGEVKTIRGVIANVTVEGETAIDFRSNRAATVEMSYLTVIGSESQGRMRGRDQSERRGDSNDRAGGSRSERRGDQNDRAGDNQAERRGDQNDRSNRDGRDQQASGERQRHNIYIVWLTPRTEIRDAASNNQRNQDERGNANADANANVNANRNATRGDNAGLARFENLEVGDRVEVRFLQKSSGEDNANAVSRRHGRHRIYFGDARSITIVSEPGQDNRDRASAPDRDENRQGNRDRRRDNSKDQQDR
jgi:hypothetical protein